MSKINYLIFCAVLICSCCVNSEKENTPIRNGFISVDGTRFNYTIEGNGIPCLVIGSSIYYPPTFSEDLRKNLKLYFVDMRWFAPERGNMPMKDFTLKSIINDIEQVRLALNLENPILIGHSIHGTIAMEYAKRYPKNIAGLVMIGSPNIYGNKEYDFATTKVWESASSKRKELQNKNWQVLADKKDEYSDAQMVVEDYCAMAPKYWYNPEYDARWLWNDMTIHADLIHHLYGIIFSNYFMFNNESRVPVPTFVALGKYDYAIPVQLWKDVRNIPSLSIQVFEKSGHTPQLEECEKFNAQLMKWLNKN